MSEFVKDQWVECVHGVPRLFEYGACYRVRENRDGTNDVYIDGSSQSWHHSRFRPVEWKVGRTYKTTREGVTVLVTHIGEKNVIGTISDTANCGIVFDKLTGWHTGNECKDRTSARDLTPYLAAEPSPAVETTEPSKSQTIRDDVHQFDTGAVRGTDANGTRFDLISPHILQALAETYAEGAKKYGDDNWLKGIPSKDLMNHALRHINLWQLGDTSEDHLAHAMWNLGAIIHFTKTRPELIVRQYAPQSQ